MPGMTTEDVRIAQMLTGFAMAAFLLISTVPALRRYASRLRVALLAAVSARRGRVRRYALISCVDAPNESWRGPHRFAMRDAAKGGEA